MKYTGQLVTGDFEENTMTFEIEGEMILQAGRYEIQQIEVGNKGKNLGIANVSGSLLSDLDYWKQRCELAEKCLEESPCDPDITSDQIKAHNAHHKFISNFGNDH